MSKSTVHALVSWLRSIARRRQPAVIWAVTVTEWPVSSPAHLGFWLARHFFVRGNSCLRSDRWLRRLGLIGPTMQLDWERSEGCITLIINQKPRASAGPTMQLDRGADYHSGSASDSPPVRVGGYFQIKLIKIMSFLASITNNFKPSNLDHSAVMKRGSIKSGKTARCVSAACGRFEPHILFEMIRLYSI